ncbi:MFS transporter [Candidatus Curculioniphilus buchneri]|uniref:MFS transporter n=1 Tax=Candidatus Curculioniphilus buchneri TaxID=690594 RepID=UPI00376EBC1E
MSKKWLILAVIILMYLPISIDTTVLNIAAPKLSIALSASGNALLWIIDIYSLVMAGLLLPMGILGDRIGYKRLGIYGLLWFALSSLAAALANTIVQLILARAALAIGASMVLPATLSAVRKTFTNERQRGIALGIWASVGTTGAAMGPLIGGWLLTHYYWGSIFLINLPVIAIVLPASWLIMPKQPKCTSQPWSIKQALMLITAILLLVLAIKHGLCGDGWQTLSAGLIGSFILIVFLRHQLRSPTPILDLSLFRECVLSTGIIMVIISLMTLVGFELLVAQELQFIHQQTPFQTGLFMMPLTLAASICSPLVSWLASVLGLRILSSYGIALCSLSFFGLSQIDFVDHIKIAWGWMMLLGFSLQMSLLASTAAIMSVVPPQKAGAAGAIEGMAYELGAGLGVAIFGMMLTSGYSATLVLPSTLADGLAIQATSSINATLQVAERLNIVEADLLRQQAKMAFNQAHSRVLTTSGICLAILTLVVWYCMPTQRVCSSVQH